MSFRVANVYVLFLCDIIPPGPLLSDSVGSAGYRFSLPMGTRVLLPDTCGIRGLFRKASPPRFPGIPFLLFSGSLILPDWSAGGVPPRPKHPIFPSKISVTVTEISLRPDRP